MTLLNLIQFFKSSWAYSYFDFYGKGLISGSDITTRMKVFDPYIELTKGELQTLNQIIDTLGGGFVISIKQFYDFYSYKQMFNNFVVPNTNNLVSQFIANDVFTRLGIVNEENARMLASEAGPDGSDLVNFETAFTQ